MGVNSLPKTVTRQRRDCDLKLYGTGKEQTNPTDRENENETRHRSEMGWHGEFSFKQSLFSDSRGLYRIENCNFD